MQFILERMNQLAIALMKDVTSLEYTENDIGKKMLSDTNELAACIVAVQRVYHLDKAINATAISPYYQVNSSKQRMMESALVLSRFINSNEIKSAEQIESLKKLTMTLIAHSERHLVRCNYCHVIDDVGIERRVLRILESA